MVLHYSTLAAASSGLFDCLCVHKPADVMFESMGVSALPTVGTKRVPAQASLSNAAWHNLS
jgi:hypothetical protein